MQKKTVIYSTSIQILNKATEPKVSEVFGKIKTLHRKNKEKERKAQQTNKKIVEDFIINKQNYKEGKQKQRQNKLSNVLKQQFKKTQTLEHHNEEKMKKTVQRLKEHKQKENQNRKIIERKSEEKMMKAQEKRKQKTMSYSKGNSQKINFQSIFYRKQAEDIQYSEKLKKKSQYKFQNAKQRRSIEHYLIEKNKYKSQMRQKIYANAEQIKKNQYQLMLRSEIEKEEKWKGRYDQMAKSEQKKIEMNKQQRKKHSENVQQMKKKNDQLKEQKKQLMLKESENKMKKYNENKSLTLSSFLQKINLQKTKTTSQVLQSYSYMKEKQREKMLEKHEKDLTQWNFLTSVRQQKDQLIQSNIFKNNELSLKK